ncbi:SRPBCC family protein [Riemerella columbina]|uniref:SRPBCC family protein n=1 Tax=Riemerella columbina TaxID=103810 RepID=UPI0003787687|nr:SRPBCC family protein [Riemerella columbina]
MRWLKVTLFIGLFIGIAYAVSMLFVDESKSFRIERTIDYPLEKVYPQFSNFQNMTRWNTYFLRDKNLKFEYFIPYEGQGSSMNFIDKKGSVGMVFIRYENPKKTLKYEFFDNDSNIPLKIEVRFVPERDKTKIVWLVTTPKKTLLKRYVNLFSVNTFEEFVNQSMTNLKNLLSNKVDKIELLSQIKYDTIMVEQQESAILVGVNATSQNKSKVQLFQSILKNHSKVINFVTNDLGKQEDEFGAPILITTPKSYDNKEVSYFYGIPLSKKVELEDNSITYRKLEPSKLYVMYYKGNYDGRISVINQLLKKAKTDSLRTGMLQEVFIENPEEQKPVILKLALPVSP